jgi:hypothetical protein
MQTTLQKIYAKDFYVHKSITNNITHKLPQLTSCQDPHQTEENFKVPKKKTAMGFGESIYSKTKSAGYSRRETQCN